LGSDLVKVKAKLLAQLVVLVVDLFAHLANSRDLSVVKFAVVEHELHVSHERPDRLIALVL